MKKANPFLEENAIPADSKFKNWQELNLKPYDKDKIVKHVFKLIAEK